MACKPVCSLCRNLVISTAVAYDSTTNTLNITIPNRGYRNCEKVCIVVAQAIPATTTINALVYIFVEGSSFPLTKCDCSQVTACEMKTRTRYCTQVRTNTTSGVFRLLGNVCCTRPSDLDTLPVTPVTPTAEGGATA